MANLMNIMRAFEVRHSTRTFSGTSLEQSHQEYFDKVIAESNSLPTPFGSNVEIGTHPAGLGKFGFISGESGWMIGKIPKDTQNMHIAQIDAGYKMHYCVMKLTQAGISTVWIGGTYSKSLAEEHNPGFDVPFAVAYGIEEQPHFMAKVVKTLGPKGRKPLEELFYDADVKAPVTEESTRVAFCHALQSGPSALNKQPWRFVFDQEKIHLFQVGGYQADMGIALANIKLLLENEGKEAKFTVLDPAPVSPFSGAKYIISVNL